MRECNGKDQVQYLQELRSRQMTLANAFLQSSFFTWLSEKCFGNRLKSWLRLWTECMKISNPPGASSAKPLQHTLTLPLFWFSSLQMMRRSCQQMLAQPWASLRESPLTLVSFHSHDFQYPHWTVINRSTCDSPMKEKIQTEDSHH